jgi:ubiquinone/menaquinone biosynthesis C-methylase UbiE/MoaA/NifB/PqqE/SkfB family radical SAM enzyme
MSYRNLVVLVADQVWPRVCKIGYGLKALGWEVVLLHRDDLIIENQAECFDETSRYTSLHMALELAGSYKPVIFHVFSCWNFDVAASLIQSRMGKIVFDSYDIFAGLVKKRFADSNYPNQTELEKYCLENAHGLTCRGLTLQVPRRKLKYAIGGKALYFPDYCWDGECEVLPANPKRDGSELHLVHAGNLCIEKQSPLENHRNGWYFLEFAREMAKSRVHFHLYPAPIYQDDFENLFSDYIELDIESPFFHIHRPVPADKLAEELTRYDIGLISVWSYFINNSEVYESDLYRYNTSNKFFDYLDAGLGIVVCPCHRLLKWYINRKKVGFEAYLETMSQELAKLSPSFWQALPSRVSKARKDFSVKIHARRLSDFYLSVSRSDLRRVFTLRRIEEQMIAVPSPVTHVTPRIPRKIGHSVETARQSSLEVDAVIQNPPSIFSIETSLLCSLGCPECALGSNRISRERGILSYERFKLVADKIRPYVQYIYLHIWGEPLLNKHIVPIIRYASAFARTNISTNGMSITAPLAEDLITSGVSDIIVSIDGFTQEIYAKYRVGGNLAKVLASLELLQKLNAKHGNRVNITPQFIVFKHNQHEMDGFQKYCRSLGLKAVFKAPYIRKSSCFQDSDKPEFVRTKYRDLKALREAMRSCTDPRSVFTILLDGSVVACCYDHNKQTCFGNIFESDVLDIWHSPRYSHFRRDIVIGDTPGFCIDNCLQYVLDDGDEKKSIIPNLVLSNELSKNEKDISISFTKQNVRSQMCKRRIRKTHTITNFSECHSIARSLYQQAKYVEAFDLYDNLAIAFPEHAVALLAEAYDMFEMLPNKHSRYHLYQSRYYNFNIGSEDKVLDIGSGHLPFPFATHLADLTFDDNKVGRAGVPFKHVDGKPVYECNIENMPFTDKEFDFVYCSHVLEHTDNPEKACDELMRIGKRGFIECPCRAKDLWLNSAKPSNHKWAVEYADGSLVFTEYTREELEGLGNDILMDMHCSPRTDREKAFSALIYLRADVVNTMLYWEDSFTYRVRRGQTPSSGPPAEIDHPSTDLQTSYRSAPKCLFINTYYENFLSKHYRSNPDLAGQSYLSQKRSLQECFFGDSDFYSSSLGKAGFQTDDIIINCLPLQETWARQNDSSCEVMRIACEQIRHYAPDIVYIQDMNLIAREFLMAIRPLVSLIVGQIATPMVTNIPFELYDLVFSSFPHYVQRLRGNGVTAYYQPLAFDPRVLERIEPQPYHLRPVQCSFVGGISNLHQESYKLLEVLVKTTPIEFWGYGANTLPADSEIRKHHHGEAWGLDMFALMGLSRITINRHGEVAENFANNMRLFEASGCGSLLVTDYKDNLNELFEVGKEIVAYRSEEECAALVNYYLKHPQEAERIACAGQARTLGDHTYSKRMEKTAEVLNRHLRYRADLATGDRSDPSTISYGHTPIQPSQITEGMRSAWKNEAIPGRQRAMVRQELAEMYRGRSAAPFSALATILKPYIFPGSKVLEIGCASGYYYEILEYLLSTHIDYTGIDYSEAMIAMARDYYPQAQFHTADGSSLFFADHSFHCVISSCILLHVPNYREHIVETVRVAKQYVVASRTPISRTRPTRYLKKYAYGLETVELIFNEEELLREFRLNGTKLLKRVEYHTDSTNDRHEVTYLFQRTT